MEAATLTIERPVLAGDRLDQPSLGETLAVGDLPGVFCLLYQPIYDLVSLQVESAETLLRWWHPDFGLLRPQACLGTTRWAGLLEDVHPWVLQTATREADRWAAAGRDVVAHVNLSTLPIHLVASGVAEVLAGGADPRLLAVDVPYEWFAREPRETARVVERLLELEVTVIADGVIGNALGAYIGAPPDAVKAPVHVRNGRDGGLHPRCIQTAGLAHDLGALAIAKAVENPAHLPQLWDAGYSSAFGFALSPPVTGEALLLRAEA